MSRQYRKVLQDIHNPFGDGRMNKAHWRSPLEKRTIPEGFIYYWDEEQKILSDAKNRRGYVYGDDARKLRQILDANSEPFEETFATVLADFNWGATTIAQIICNAKGISPAELRQILKDDEDDESE